MQRRAFMNVTASAATALAFSPLALAEQQERKTPVLYPDPAVEIIDPRFAKYKVVNAAVERLYTGARWAEGPVWFGDGRYLLFSDIPNNRILRWLEDTSEVSVFRNPSNYTNGNYRDLQGRLLSCEHDSRRLTRTEHDGTVTVLIERFEGKQLNAPNDLAVHSNGSIWFTDPGYGIMSNYEGHKAPFELPANVYRLDPKTLEVTVVVSDMDTPNGICFSPDEKKLYIVDTGIPKKPADPRPIRVYDVEDGVRLHEATSELVGRRLGLAQQGLEFRPNPTCSAARMVALATWDAWAPASMRAMTSAHWRVRKSVPRRMWPIACGSWAELKFPIGEYFQPRSVAS